MKVDGIVVETPEFFPIALPQRRAGILFEELVPLLPKDPQLFLSSLPRVTSFSASGNGRAAQQEKPQARKEENETRGSRKVLFIHSSQSFPSNLPRQGHVLQRGLIPDRTDG